MAIKELSACRPSEDFYEVDSSLILIFLNMCVLCIAQVLIASHKHETFTERAHILAHHRITSFEEKASKISRY